MKMIAIMVIFLSSTIFPVSSFAKNGNQLLDFLKSRDFKNLEAATRRIQSQFENGALSEIELRNTYRQFYNLDNNDLNNLQEWKSKYPSSYSAYLIRGVYYKRKGNDARGTNYISDTPQDNIEKMRQYHEIAEKDLNVSLKLTKKPYLSVFHLLEICQLNGDIKTALKLLASANKMLPSNTLVRNRYIRSLEPRWGGSYEQMKGFIAKTKTERVNAKVIMQLEAIMYDDMGLTYMERGDKRAAIDNLLKALDLGQRIGGEFRKDFLINANNYSCSEPALKKYCQ